MLKKLLTICALCFLFVPKTNSQSLYFPPLTGNTWDTISPVQLGWCTNYLDTLNTLLQSTNTKAFIILKDGKIAWEKYYGTFTTDSLWYWASAGKTLTAFTVGMAQQQGLLSINDTTSKYLGTGWTVCPAVKESLITVRHQLTMTTGLDDNVPDEYCTIDTCLQYLANAGTRWAYHNGPYTLLHDVINNATGHFTSFFNSNLRNRIGMDGFWFSQSYNRIYYSKPRSMARFGLLNLNKGIWNTDTVMTDTTFYHAMVNTSQNINLSYGYLWWLNGKGSFMLPGVQFQFTGNIIPNAPADLFCALGKDDQKIHVVPSQNLVVVRMGNAAYGNQLVPLALDNNVWAVLNNVFCTANGLNDYINFNNVLIFPNPVSSELVVESIESIFEIKIFDLLGKEIEKSEVRNQKVKMDVSNFENGIYFLSVMSGNGKTTFKKFLVQKN